MLDGEPLEHPVFPENVYGAPVCEGRHGKAGDVGERNPVIQGGGEHVARLGQEAPGFFGEASLRDVPLGSPGPDQAAVFHYAREVVEETPGPAFPVHLDGLGVGDPVPRSHKILQVFLIFRHGSGQKVAKPRPDYLPGARETVHGSHRVVAFGQVAVFVEPLYLLFHGQVRRNGLLQFEAPDALGRLLDESLVAFRAPSHFQLGLLMFGHVPEVDGEPVL